MNYRVLCSIGRFAFKTIDVIGEVCECSRILAKHDQRKSPVGRINDAFPLVTRPRKCKRPKNQRQTNCPYDEYRPLHFSIEMRFFRLHPKPTCSALPKHLGAIMGKGSRGDFVRRCAFRLVAAAATAARSIMGNFNEAALSVSEAELSIRILEIILVRIAYAMRPAALDDIDLDRPAKRCIADCHQPPVARDCNGHRTRGGDHSRRRRRRFWRQLGCRNLS